MQDLDRAGGIPAVQAELLKKGLLDPGAITVTGKTVGENIAGAKIADTNAAISSDRPALQPQQGEFRFFGATWHRTVVLLNAVPLHRKC